LVVLNPNQGRLLKLGRRRIARGGSASLAIQAVTSCHPAEAWRRHRVAAVLGSTEAEVARDDDALAGRAGSMDTANKFRRVRLPDRQKHR